MKIRRGGLSSPGPLCPFGWGTRRGGKHCHSDRRVSALFSPKRRVSLRPTPTTNPARRPVSKWFLHIYSGKTTKDECGLFISLLLSSMPIYVLCSISSRASCSFISVHIFSPVPSHPRVRGYPSIPVKGVAMDHPEPVIWSGVCDFISTESLTRSFCRHSPRRPSSSRSGSRQTCPCRRGPTRALQAPRPPRREPPVNSRRPWPP